MKRFLWIPGVFLGTSLTAILGCSGNSSTQTASTAPTSTGTTPSYPANYMGGVPGSSTSDSTAGSTTPDDASSSGSETNDNPSGDAGDSVAGYNPDMAQSGSSGRPSRPSASSGGDPYAGSGYGGQPSSGGAGYAGGYPGSDTASSSGSETYSGPGSDAYAGAPSDGSSGYNGPGSFAGGPNAPQARKLEDMTFRERAEDAFSKGHEPEAIALLQAHALADPSDAAEILDGYRWSAFNKQPQLLSRIAVGVDLKAPPSVSNYNPIDASKLGNGAGGSSDMGGYGAMGPGGTGAGGSEAQSAKSLESLTGDLGRALTAHVKEMFLAGQLGPVFASVAETASTPNPNSGGYDPYGGQSDGMMGMGPGMGGGQGSGRGPTGKFGIPNRNRLTPGLTFLGVDSLADLQSKAKEQGFDFLVAYEVTAETNRRTSSVNNETKVRCFKIGDRKPVGTTDSLNAMEVMRKMYKGEMEIVEKAMNRIFTKMDPEVALASMPAVTGEMLKKSRLGVLTTNSTRDKISTLSELQLWKHLKCLTDDELAAAYQAILGEADGKLLAEGSTEERKALLSKFLPKG